MRRPCALRTLEPRRRDPKPHDLRARKSALNWSISAQLMHHEAQKQGNASALALAVLTWRAQFCALLPALSHALLFRHLAPCVAAHAWPPWRTASAQMR
jgi:hypothetical protein